MTGKVKWYDKEKGYGFITPDGGTCQSDDVFVHVGQVKRSQLETLNEGDVVLFDTFQGKKSVAAKNIRVLGQKREQAPALHTLREDARA